MRSTGWGRPDLEALTDRSLLALRRWATPGHARFDLPGPASRAGRLSDGLEAFARSFLAAGFRLSAADHDDHDHAGWYGAGLVAGTDPASGEAWPSLTEIGQTRVEAAAIAIALHESRSWIWDRLDGDARRRIIDWLAPSGQETYGLNNWRWFCNVTQAFLRSVGGPYDQQLIDDNIALMDQWYLGEVDGRGGWYSDGPTGSIDWYNGWVMHLFALWYCRMSPGVPGVEALQDRYRARLRDYLDQLPLLFGGDGAPLFQGRSLIYRYATVGAPWAGAIFDASPLPAGELRRLCFGGIRYFVDRGAFTDDGLLSMGWLGRHERMRQPYSGPGSPYWSSLGLAGLVIGADDPFWAEPEQPLPVKSRDVDAALPQPGWLVTATRSDGIVRVINHGVDHGGDAEDPLYGRLAYSTATAPVSAGPGEIADNQVVLIDGDGVPTRRHPFDLIAIGDRRATSSWGPIRCWSVVHRGVEVRLVRLTSPGPDGNPDGDPDGVGAADRADGRVGDPVGDRLVISGYAVPLQPAPGARATLRAPVRCLFGDGVEQTTVHDQDNPFGSSLRVDRVEFTAPRSDRWYAAGIALADHDHDAAAGPEWPVVSEIDGRLAICWADGTLDRVG